MPPSRLEIMRMLDHDVKGLLERDAPWTAKELAKAIGVSTEVALAACKRLVGCGDAVDVSTSRQRLPRFTLARGGVRRSTSRLGFSPLSLVEPVPFEVLALAVKAILEDPHGRDWSLHGFGMLRAYLSDEWRLHVWSSDHAVPGVSALHNHPWAFESYVLSGSVSNARFCPVGVDAERMDERLSGWWATQEILCGPDGCATSGVRYQRMVATAPEVIRAGGSYRQAAEEVHASSPSHGAVTIIHRRFQEDTEHARVYWRPEERWVSAEPRQATTVEVGEITKLALRLW